MILSTFLLSSTLILSQPISGFAAGYDKGVMGHSATANHMIWSDCMVATDLAPLGRWVVIKSHLTGEERLCRIVDHSASEDLQRHLTLGPQVESNWASALAMCQLNYVGQEPWRKCPITIRIVEQGVKHAEREV